MKIAPRFNYANVMSTLAVFLAIGGSAIAISTIDGSKLVNRSVPGKKLKKNTVKGKEVRERALGEVPQAAAATTATTADSATTATTAANALQLGGLEPFDFERATTVLDGRGAINSTSPQAIFGSINAGFTLTTDGDADNNTQLLLQNNNPVGNLIGTVFTSTAPPTAFGVAAGTSQQIGPASGAGTDFFDAVITDAGTPAKSVSVHCLFNFSAGVPTAFCWGLQT